MFSVMQAALFRVLVLYNPLESRTGAMDYFYCPAFTTESSHQISCLPFVFHKTHQVYVVLVYFPCYCVPVMSLVPHKFPLLIDSSPTYARALRSPDQLWYIRTSVFTETFSRKQIIYTVSHTCIPSSRRCLSPINQRVVRAGMRAGIPDLGLVGLRYK